MDTIRQLAPRDAVMVTTFRLAALQNWPGMFSSTYEQEAVLPVSRWAERLAVTNSAAFGLFDGETMIGLTAIFTDRDDPTGETCALAMSYIVPDYRGRGLSALFYEARLAWARARPQYKKVVVGHRVSNDASRRANQRHGFRLTGRSTQVWPDGAEDEMLHYELPL